jgi:uncharacterized protein
LGLAYENGLGVQKDPQKATEFYKLSNTKNAFVRLGYLHFVEKDFTKAHEYFLNSDSPDGYFYIGLMHLDGVGLPQNKKLALEFFEKSGNEESKVFIKKINDSLEN